MENFTADAIFIDAPLERVFDALVDPNDVLVWMDAEEARISPGVGGEFTVRRTDGTVVRGRIERFERPHRLEISDYYWEDGTLRRGPMRLRFTLEPRDEGVWIVVRQDDLDAGGVLSWEEFAQATRRELIRWTVTLKRHIEGI